MDSKPSTVIFNSLNDDVRHHILQYFGKKSYMIFGSINKSCNNLFKVKRLPRKTSLYTFGTFEQIMEEIDKEAECNFKLSQYYGYDCWRGLAKGIVLHNRRDLWDYAIEEKNSCLFESIFFVACEAGKLEIIQEVFRKADEKEIRHIVDDDYILTRDAALGGHLETLQWLLKNGCSWDPDNICLFAASSGNVDMLKWLLNYPQNFSWDETTCVEAAREGHLEMLKLLIEKGCPWDDRICSYACENGHLDVLKWSLEKGCELNKGCSELAAKGGHLECLKYLHDNNCPWDSDTALAATKGGHLDILKYLYMNGCEWNTKIPIVAAYPNSPYHRSYMHILEWIHYRGFGFDKKFTFSLVSHDRLLPILKWLHHCGYEMYDELPSVAASNKSFDTLRWLREIGIKWDEYGKYLDGDMNEKQTKRQKISK